jgi:hypothetical protein
MCPVHGQTNVPANGNDSRHAMAEPAPQHQRSDPRTVQPPGPPVPPIPDEMAPLGSLAVGWYIKCPCGCNGPGIIIDPPVRGAFRASDRSQARWCCKVGTMQRPADFLVSPLPREEWPAEAPDPRPIIERARGALP